MAKGTPRRAPAARKAPRRALPAQVREFIKRSRLQERRVARFSNAYDRLHESSHELFASNERIPPTPEQTSRFMKGYAHLYKWAGRILMSEPKPPRSMADNDRPALAQRLRRDAVRIKLSEANLHKEWWIKRARPR